MLMTDDYRYECEHCHMSFVREDNYLKHKCKQMIREEQIKTPLGHAAYIFYGKWLKSNNRAVPTIATFLTSKYYNIFFEFARFTKRIKLPDIDLFIKLMKSKDLLPQFWTRDDVYVFYNEYLDAQIRPPTHMKYTVQTIFNLCDIFDCDPKDLFQHLNVSEWLQLLRERRISPWILLHSREFVIMFRNLHPSERDLFEQLIRPGYWTYIINKKGNEKFVDLAKLMTKEMGI